MMDVSELKQRLDAGDDMLILDVRSAEDYNGEQKHIHGSVSLPLEQLDQRIAELEEENDCLREDAGVLRAELKEYKLALEDARSVIKEAVERIKPLWPFVSAWLPESYCLPSKYVRISP